MFVRRKEGSEDGAWPASFEIAGNHNRASNADPASRRTAVFELQIVRPHETKSMGTEARADRMVFRLLFLSHFTPLCQLGACERVECEKDKRDRDAEERREGLGATASLEGDEKRNFWLPPPAVTRRSNDYVKPLSCEYGYVIHLGN
eukprot:1925701-Rhodomonas_salina.2